MIEFKMQKTLHSFLMPLFYKYCHICKNIRLKKIVTFSFQFYYNVINILCITKMLVSSLIYVFNNLNTSIGNITILFCQKKKKKTISGKESFYFIYLLICVIEVLYLIVLYTMSALSTSSPSLTYESAQNLRLFFLHCTHFILKYVTYHYYMFSNLFLCLSLLCLHSC